MTAKIYPNHLPTPPSSFEVAEYTEFYQRQEGKTEFEVILESKLCDLRLSSHSMRWSGTIRICDEFGDYIFEDQSKFISWIRSIFQIHKECVGLHLEPTKSPPSLTKDVIGLTPNSEKVVCNKENGICISESNFSPEKFHRFNVHDPKSVGELQYAVEIDGPILDRYLYIHSDVVIEFTQLDDPQLTQSYLSYPYPNIEKMLEYVKNMSKQEEVSLIKLGGNKEIHRLVSSLI